MRKTNNNINSGAELMEALSQIVHGKKIDKSIVFEAIEASLISACKKNFGMNAEIIVNIDEETGSVKVFQQKTVVETVEDTSCQLSLAEAQEIKKTYKIDDVVSIEVAPKDFGRVSAQSAKQMVVQRFREAEREALYQEYLTKQNTLVTGIIQRREHRNIIIGLGNIDAVMPQNEQIHREPYNPPDRLRVFVADVKNTGKGPVVTVSRSSPLLVEKMFEQEVPEIYDGIVEVKSIAREAGIRTKIAVHSSNPNVDPVGSCVGPSGSRVNAVIAELRGEKIDIVRWSEDPIEYISSALSPSRVELVAINPYDMSAKIIVQDNQLSLAIGKEGQNARLAARLTGWRIDIKNISQAYDTGFITQEELDLDYQQFLREKEQLQNKELEGVEYVEYDEHDENAEYTEQNEQPEQTEQPEQAEQNEQNKQNEQNEQNEQPEQTEQTEQAENIVQTENEPNEV